MYEPILDAAKKRADKAQDKLDALLWGIETQGRKSLTPAEERKFAKLARKLKAASADEREFAEKVHRLGIAEAASAASYRPMGRGADTVYVPNSGQSYFRDLMKAATPGGAAADPDAYAATQRLTDHAKCVSRAMADLPDVFRVDETRGMPGAPDLEVRVTPYRDPGAGGYPSGAVGFGVPPLYLVDQWLKALRPGRATADRCRQYSLPAGTDAINIPGFNVPTQAGVQAIDLAGLPSRDWTERVVTGPVRTLAGNSDFSMQLLEQSSVQFDEIIYQDLMADINKQLDLQVLTGTGTSGQVQGLTTMAGTNAITFTSGAPTVPLLYPFIGQGVSQVEKQRFASVDTIVMHPSHWNWIASSLDGQNRPLVVPDAGFALNTVATINTNAAEGVAGSIFGIPVVLDANVPTNLGAGTNQAPILIGRFDDFWLYESAMRFRAYPGVLSGVLGMRLQAYEYFTFIGSRYPVSLSVINGTGQVVPAGY
jgi:Phage capsid family